MFQPGRDDDLGLSLRMGRGAAVACSCSRLPCGRWATSNARFPWSKELRRGSRARRISARSRLDDIIGAVRTDARRPSRGRAERRRTRRLAREHDLPQWRAFATFFRGWALRRRDGELGDGLEDMRRGVELLREQNVLIFDGLDQRLRWRRPRSQAGDTDRALAILDEALATCDRLGYRTFEAELHRARGEILLKRDPANPAPAEDAFLTAIAVAKRQGDAQLRTARGAGARQALSIDRAPHRRARRPRAARSKALRRRRKCPRSPRRRRCWRRLRRNRRGQGGSADAQRQRLTHLHVAYGNALIAARGFGAPETTEAFARARKSASGDKDAPERLAADYRLWAGSYARGELPSMQAHAAAFLADVEARPDSPEAGVAHRAAGITCWFAGEYREARDHLERALALFQPGRDDDLAFRFGLDPGVAAMAYLGVCVVASRRRRSRDFAH